MLKAHCFQSLSTSPFYFKSNCLARTDAELCRLVLNGTTEKGSTIHFVPKKGHLDKDFNDLTLTSLKLKIVFKLYHHHQSPFHSLLAYCYILIKNCMLLLTTTDWWFQSKKKCFQFHFVMCKEKNYKVKMWSTYSK